MGFDLLALKLDIRGPGYWVQGSLVPMLCLGMGSQRLRLGFWVHAGMRVIWRLTFTKWKAEPSGMHSHAEHGNEKKLEIRNSKLGNTGIIACVLISNFQFQISTLVPTQSMGTRKNWKFEIRNWVTPELLRVF